MTDKDKKGDQLQVVDVATQTDKRIQLPNGEIVDFATYLVWLGNQVLEIKKQI